MASTHRGGGRKVGVAHRGVGGGCMLESVGGVAIQGKGREGDGQAEGWAGLAVPLACV